MAAIVASCKATVGYALVDVRRIGQCGFHYTPQLSRFTSVARARYPRGCSTILKVATSGIFPSDKEQLLPVRLLHHTVALFRSIQ
jgi:hypothetical protein